MGLPQPADTYADAMRLRVTLLLLALWCAPVRAQNITSFVGSTGSVNVSNSAVNYFAFSGIDGISTSYNGSGTVTFVTSPSIHWTLRNLYCFSGTNPGTGKSYKIEITVAGFGALPVTVTISDSATSASDTVNTFDTIAFGSGSWAYQVTPTATPTATTIACYIEASID